MPERGSKPVDAGGAASAPRLTPIMDEATCSSQSVRCAASWSGGVGAPARPSSPAGLCRSWPPGGAPCPLPRPPPEVAVSPFVAPTRPAARRLRRAPEAAAAADERLRAGGRPTPAMGPPRRRKVGRGEARRRVGCCSGDPSAASHVSHGPARGGSPHGRRVGIPQIVNKRCQPCICSLSTIYINGVHQL